VGFDKNGMPVCISFIGKLYDEASLIAFAKAYQDATAFHLAHPKIFQ
jgi:Asp-tRNA(Asn)/Glu-tRNA(Gln) amidotransferase A subunit family amidase